MRRQTLILMATFLGLATASYYAVRQEPQRGMVRLQLSQKAVTKTDHIIIAQGSKTPVELTRNGPDAPWTLAGGHPADAVRVDRLLAEVAAINTSDMITQDTGRFVDLHVEGDKALGLSLAQKGRSVVALRIGEAEAPRTYYLREGDTVFRGQGDLAQMLQGQAADWEERRLPTPDAAALTGLTIKARDQQPVVLTATPQSGSDVGLWAAQEGQRLPEGMRFDPGAAGALARALANARAERLIDEQPGDAVTKLSQADTITWTQEGSAEAHVLRLGAALPDHPQERFAQIDGVPQLYAVSEQAAVGLLKSWDDLRALTVMAPADFAEVKEALLQAPGTKATVLKKAADGTFTVASAAKRFVPDAVKVRGRIQQALLARAIKYVGPAKASHGLGRSNTGAITLTYTNGTRATLQFGRALKGAEGTGYFARGSADKDVYVISKALHDTLMGGPSTLSRDPRPAGATTHVASPAMPGLTPEMEAQIRAQLAAAEAH